MKKLILIFVLLLGANTVRAQHTLDTLYHEFPGHSVMSISEKVDGRLHGICRTYMNGKIFSEVTYFDNELSGPFKHYYKNAKANTLFSTGEYLFGKHEGLVQIYDKSGAKAGQLDYKNGKVVGRVNLEGEYFPMVIEN